MEYRSALVTGASRGIGAAIARALIAEGLVVHALARDGAALADLARALGPNLRPLVLDLTDAGAIGAQLPGLAVDVLVNNAGGLGSVRPLWQQDLAETAQTIALNLTAPLQIIQALLPGMIARGRGHIFNLCSTAGQGALAGTAVYGAAKAALSQAGRALRYDLAGQNIRLTEIAPGRVETDFYLAAFGGDAEGLKDKMYRHQRALTPEDIAQTLVAALRLPAHATLAEITLSPTDQALGGHVFANVSPLEPAIED